MNNKKKFKNVQALALGLVLLFAMVASVFNWYAKTGKGEATMSTGKDPVQNEAAPQKDRETLDTTDITSTQTALAIIEPPENDERLQGNIPGNVLGVYNTSIVVERGDMRFFLSRDGNRKDYQKLTGLYGQGVGDTAAERIAYGYIENPQMLGDFVYYRDYYKKDQLNRVNVKAEEPRPEIVLEGVRLFSLYDHWVYYWNKDDTFVYRLDLTDAQATPQKLAGFADLASLMTRGDFILIVERDFKRSAQRVETTNLVWKISPDGLKKDILIRLPASGGNFVQPYQDRLYYLQDNKIWRMDFTGEYKAQVVTPDSSKIDSFIVYDKRIYMEEYNYTYPHMYTSVDLEGGDKRHIFTYRSPEGPDDSFNGVIDGMHIIGFNVTRDYLFIGGYSYYHGEFLTTRVPIAGDAERKEEEVFFNGAWGSIGDYIKEIRRVQAFQGFAQ